MDSLLGELESIKFAAWISVILQALILWRVWPLFS
jgi:hypothetical protein